jgi:small-conductance mechanosensitive channel
MTIHSRTAKWISAVGLWLLLGMATAAWGQVRGLMPKEPGAVEEKGKEVAPPTIPDLEQALATATERLQNFQTLLTTTPAQQFGGTNEEASEKTALLARQVLAVEQHLMALSQMEETRLASQDLEAKVGAWKGFGISPPYPLGLLDELRDSIVAQKILVEKDKTLISFVRQEQDRGRERLEQAQKRRRQVMEMLEKPAAPGDQLRRGWLDDLARLKEATVQTEILSAGARLQAAEAALALHGDKLAFLDRQLQVAEAAPADFTQAELEKRLAAVAHQEQQLDAEQLRASRESTKVEKELVLARTDLQRARATAAPPAVVEQLQELLELRKAQSDNLALKIEFYRIRNLVLAAEKLIWEERHRMAQGVDEVELQQLETRLLAGEKRLQDYHSYLNSGLNLAQQLALAQRQRLADLAGSDPLRDPVQKRLDVYVERSDFLLRAMASLNDVLRLDQRLLQEVQSRREHAGLEQRLHGLAARARDLARRLWTYEIFVAEDTILVEGQKVTKERPITTGKVAVALAILVVGLWLAFLLRDRTRSLVARWFKLEAVAAVLVEKILTMLVIIAVFAFALITVKIPLTVFAFMGGALAIGVGFGAQNLINNWISGMILLLERPIKVGDVVEIDSGRGRVTNIGARCSQVRRFDGFDVLVPNSEFLQKSVINLTLADEVIRLKVRVGVAYGSPTREVARIMAAALAEHGRILKEPEPVVLFEDFGDSALIFSAYFWVQVSPSYDYRIIESDFRHMLDRRFGEAGIVIAFPQLDVHLDGAGPQSKAPDAHRAGEAD